MRKSKYLRKTISQINLWRSLCCSGVNVQYRWLPCELCERICRQCWKHSQPMSFYYKIIFNYYV